MAVMVPPEALLSVTRVTPALFHTLNSLRQPAPRTVTLISTLIQGRPTNQRGRTVPLSDLSTLLCRPWVARPHDVGGPFGAHAGI